MQQQTMHTVQKAYVWQLHESLEYMGAPSSKIKANHFAAQQASLAGLKQLIPKPMGLLQDDLADKAVDGHPS